MPGRQPRPRLGVGCHEHRQHIHRPTVAWFMVRLRFRRRKPKPAGLRRHARQARWSHFRSTQLVGRFHAIDVSRHAVSAKRQSHSRPARPKPSGRSRSAPTNLTYSHSSTKKHLDERPGGRELAATHRDVRTCLSDAVRDAPEARLIYQKKPRATRNLYGIGKQPTDEYGRNCLIARRLVERGVRFIQLYSGGGHLEDTWDGHESIEKNHGLHGAEVDQPIAALVDRSRTTRPAGINPGRLGRRIWPHAVQRRQGRARAETTTRTASSMWMAGGGVKGGMSFGETDEFGFQAMVDKTHVHDIHATILHLDGNRSRRPVLLSIKAVRKLSPTFTAG